MNNTAASCGGSAMITTTAGNKTVMERLPMVDYPMAFSIMESIRDAVVSKFTDYINENLAKNDCRGGYEFNTMTVNRTIDTWFRYTKMDEYLDNEAALDKAWGKLAKKFKFSVDNDLAADIDDIYGSIRSDIEKACYRQAWCDALAVLQCLLEGKDATFGGCFLTDEQTEAKFGRAQVEHGAAFEG